MYTLRCVGASANAGSRVKVPLPAQPQTAPRLKSQHEASVVAKTAELGDVDTETASVWHLEMLKFLAVCARTQPAHGWVPVPSQLIDHAWHAFILHTREYQSYCESNFGRFIHHTGADGSDTEAFRRAIHLIDYAMTVSEVQRLFGAADPNVWPSMCRAEATL